MADKRNPSHVLLLRFDGKKAVKLELFDRRLFPGESRRGAWRMRVNGRWHPNGFTKFYTKTEIKNMVFRGLDAS